jgi:hypothetical protein
VSLRTDSAVEDAIEALQEATGASRSGVVRAAVLQAADRTRREELRREALALREDPSDRAEARAVLAFMGGSDAW